MQRRLKIGIDVGGTFTHAVAIDVDQMELAGKAVVPTTHHADEGVARGVVQSMQKLLAEAQISPDEVVLIAHSTTQATNALLEGDVAKVGVLALGTGAQGLRARQEANVGTVELGGGAKLFTSFRFLDTAGGIDEAKARELLVQLRDDGCQAIVAAEPFSVDDPRREERICELARSLGLPATPTSSLSQLYGLRMRTLTAVVNASMLPKMVETAERTAQAVAQSGIAAPLMVMRSDGGIMDLAAMRERPILTMLSGPAAGVAAALMYERITNGVFVEVGGTSSDICLIKNGRPQIKHAEIGGRRLFIRTLDVRTVGVAGGSMPRGRSKLVDVGPRSAHIAGLKYETFETAKIEFELAHVQPKKGDPDDYIALGAGGGKASHALTPTGASNILGLAQGYSRGNETSVRRAFESVARSFGTDAKTLATRMLELASKKVAPVVKALLVENKAKAAEFVMVGGGGGAEAIVPFTAHGLGMEYRIARHAEVISAIGVALGILQDTVERTLLSPSESDLLALRKEAFERVLRMGADPSSIEVHVEVDRKDKRVRATARGTPQMRSRELGGALPSDTQLAEVAAKTLGVEVEALQPLPTGGWLRAYTAEKRVPALFGLLRLVRTPVCVLDAEGIVRFSTDDAFALRVAPTEIESTLSSLLERFSTWGDAGLVLPEVQLVKPTQTVDLSGLIEPAQLVALARAEAASLGAADHVVVLVRRRD
jgi:N-methylhydantoinase A/oxoprolinase/acetone carboxylase beta subunit